MKDKFETIQNFYTRNEDYKTQSKATGLNCKFRQHWECRALSPEGDRKGGTNVHLWMQRAPP